MKRFLIQREMDGIGAAPRNDLNNAGKGSEEVLETMRSEGKNIQQEQSYVLGNSIFCVYLADSEDLINEHSKLSGTPVTKISEVTAVLKHNTSFVSQWIGQQQQAQNSAKKTSNGIISVYKIGKNGFHRI